MKYLGSDRYLLETTGREFRANRGIVGLSPDLETSQGYDDGLEDAWEPLTKKERCELADFMIDLWTAYKIAKPTEAI